MLACNFQVTAVSLFAHHYVQFLVDRMMILYKKTISLEVIKFFVSGSIHLHPFLVANKYTLLCLKIIYIWFDIHMTCTLHRTSLEERDFCHATVRDLMS